MLRLGGALAAGAAVAAAAGCASGGSSSSSSAASSAVATTSASSASSSSASSSAASSAPAASSPASSDTATAPSGPASSSPGSSGSAADGCATRYLQVKPGVAQGAAGSVYQVIDFTNIGTTACTLYGYPGVSLAAGTPVTQVGLAAKRSTIAGPAVVTLAPGATGNALLRITQALNYPQATCSPKATTYLQIYTPNQTTPVYVGYKSTGCTSTKVNLLTIGVVQPGAGSGQ
ncbi:MAG TPA: DUF4232 domain-containing protein [Trebonia sp.]|nr:DUF4232 domain-containing protein [Trebonia sp.]